MMPANEYGKRFEPVYSDGTKVEFRNIEIHEAPPPAPYVPQSWLSIPEHTLSINCPMRNWQWNRIIGWQGKTAYRARHLQRLKAFGMIRRGYMKRATD